MSYQVLARKWRPQTFEEVVGQGHIITALSNGLKEQRLHHAYLFSGTRGVGKTSIARLFAKGLNCIKNGITDHPCGECENCKAIEQGTFIDLIEIDAASRTKVEDTRELLDNVQYKPVIGRFKVYLIDEVHMLSRHSFNALLKTLEEPPEYVKFLLATTDPQKLPVTILSRCMQFHLKALDEKQISQHLANILTQENISFEPLALDKLAKAAQGGIRDSLSLTDQAIAMGDSNVTVNVVNAMLGLLDDTQAIDIIYALHQGNGERLMNVIQTVSEKAGDWDQLLAEVAEKLHQIALMQLLPRNTANEDEHLTFLAKYISPEDVQFFYQVVILGRKELSAAPNYRVGVEMTLLRALAFHPKFLTAAPKANLPTNTPLSAEKGIVENQGNYINIPVLSQNIKSNYRKTKSVQPISSLSKNNETNFAGLAALEALKQLDQIETSERQARQKEMNEAVNEAIHQVQTLDEQKTQRKMTALAVREMSPPKKIEQVISKNVQTMMNTIEDNSDLEQENQEIVEAENYRWEWRNPELAKETAAIAPSDIKQAILKDITPELNSRIIEMTKERDKWANIVESSGVSGFSKELALNCFLLDKTEDKIYLGLHPTKAHLRQERSIHLLAEAFSQFYEKSFTIDIQLDERDIATPMTHRKQIYQDLREQARDELQQDKNLLLLQKEFDAKLDMDSIRPV